MLAIPVLSPVTTATPFTVPLPQRFVAADPVANAAPPSAKKSAAAERTSGTAMADAIRALRIANLLFERTPHHDPADGPREGRISNPVSGARGRLAARRHAIAVLVTERAGGLLGQRVAVPLAVGGPHEGRDDLQVPLRDLGRLTPEIGEAQVDIQLEQVDTRRSLGHANTVERRSDGRRGWDSVLA